MRTNCHFWLDYPNIMGSTHLQCLVTLKSCIQFFNSLHDKPVDIVKSAYCVQRHHKGTFTLRQIQTQQLQAFLTKKINTK